MAFPTISYRILANGLRQSFLQQYVHLWVQNWWLQQNMFRKVRDNMNSTTISWLRELVIILTSASKNWQYSSSLSSMHIMLNCITLQNALLSLTVSREHPQTLTLVAASSSLETYNGIPPSKEKAKVLNRLFRMIRHSGIKSREGQHQSKKYYNKRVKHQNMLVAGDLVFVDKPPAMTLSSREKTQSKDSSVKLNSKKAELYKAIQLVYLAVTVDVDGIPNVITVSHVTFARAADGEPMNSGIKYNTTQESNLRRDEHIMHPYQASNSEDSWYRPGTIEMIIEWQRKTHRNVRCKRLFITTRNAVELNIECHCLATVQTSISGNLEKIYRNTSLHNTNSDFARKKNGNPGGEVNAAKIGVLRKHKPVAVSPSSDLQTARCLNIQPSSCRVSRRPRQSATQKAHYQGIVGAKITISRQDEPTSSIATTSRSVDPCSAVHELQRGLLWSPIYGQLWSLAYRGKKMTVPSGVRTLHQFL